MNDKELLENAARAARIDIQGWFGDDSTGEWWADIGPVDVVRWNPLVNDDDAVKLAFELGITGMMRRVKELFSGETLATDQHSAMRRAIVRSAAEIGSKVGAPQNAG
jgi:hypothetical protein